MLCYVMLCYVLCIDLNENKKQKRKNKKQKRKKQKTKQKKESRENKRGVPVTLFSLLSFFSYEKCQSYFVVTKCQRLFL